MCFHGNQLSWGINHPLISLWSKYHSFAFIRLCTMLAPVISSLDEIYCTCAEAEMRVSTLFDRCVTDQRTDRGRTHRRRWTHRRMDGQISYRVASRRLKSKNPNDPRWDLIGVWWLKQDDGNTFTAFICHLRVVFKWLVAWLVHWTVNLKLWTVNEWICSLIALETRLIRRFFLEEANATLA